MTKTIRSSAGNAEETFHKHYAAIWGKERWEGSLYPALAQPTKYVALLNQYAERDDFWKAIDDAQIPRQQLLKWELPSVSLPATASTGSALECVERAPPSTNPPFPPPLQGSGSLQTHWNLDAASVLVAHLLAPRPGDKVLDLCAAPGGKSVALAQSLWPHLHATDPHPIEPTSTSILHSNEIDGPRNKRLQQNLSSYLPASLFATGRILVTRLDATQTQPGPGSLRSQTYDRVLVDAPCSSERHILHAQIRAKGSSSGHAPAPELARWRPGSSKSLAKIQLEILMAGIRAAKVGGRIVYATCSIEPGENDGVVEKMLGRVEKEGRKGAAWRVRLGWDGDEEQGVMDERLWRFAERTRYGWIVLPDHGSHGSWGPLFFAPMTKILAPG